MRRELSERFRGKDVVVNLVGILNERGFGGDGFRRAHTELTRVVLQAARSAGVTRLLQVSALKAAVDAPSYYLRSKGEAERLIREQSASSGLDDIPALGDVWSRRFVLEPLCALARRGPLRFPARQAQRAVSARVCRRCDRCDVALPARRIVQPSDLRARRSANLHAAGNRRMGRKDHQPAPLDHRPAGLRRSASGNAHGLRSGTRLLERQLSLVDASTASAPRTASRSSKSGRTPWSPARGNISGHWKTTRG